MNDWVVFHPDSAYNQLCEVPILWTQDRYIRTPSRVQVMIRWYVIWNSQTAKSVCSLAYCLWAINLWCSLKYGECSLNRSANRVLWPWRSRSWWWRSWSYITSIEWWGVPHRCDNRYGECPCPDCPWAAYHLPDTHMNVTVHTYTWICFN